MRPRGQTPRMPAIEGVRERGPVVRTGFNEAAGADPADAGWDSLDPGYGRPSCFNEAAGADPADATLGSA